MLPDFRHFSLCFLIVCGIFRPTAARCGIALSHKSHRTLTTRNLPQEGVSVVNRERSVHRPQGDFHGVSGTQVKQNTKPENRPLPRGCPYRGVIGPPVPDYPLCLPTSLRSCRCALLSWEWRKRNLPGILQPHR